jgi:hypothetical protein
MEAPKSQGVPEAITRKLAQRDLSGMWGTTLTRTRVSVQPLGDVPGAERYNRRMEREVH